MDARELRSALRTWLDKEETMTQIDGVLAVSGHLARVLSEQLEVGISTPVARFTIRKARGRDH